MKIAFKIWRSLSYRFRAKCWLFYEAIKPLWMYLSYGIPQKQVFIFGCQRSGTTHLEKLFRADCRSIVYGEFSELSEHKGSTRWRELHAIKKIFSEKHARYVVARSLLASSCTLEVLEHFTEARVIWMFREPTSVVDSMIRKWGDGFKEVSEKVEVDSLGNWALRELWCQIENEVAEICPTRDQDRHVANSYALYWLYRNKLYFDLRLHEHPRVESYDYYEFSKSPKQYIDTLLTKSGIGRPKFRFPLRTRVPKKNKKNNIKLSPEIALRCEEVYRMLVEYSETGKS